MISCFILITKQLILCGLYKENLHTDKLAGADLRVKFINLMLKKVEFKRKYY